MNKPSHTPGPWAVSKNYQYVFGRQDGPGLEPVGFVYGPSGARDSLVGKRALADCRLIAAAPDMLDLLRRFGDINESPASRDSDYDALEAQARELISKTTE